MSVKRQLVVLLFVLSTIFGITGVAWAENYPWPHNGCTSSLDRPSGFDFKDACDRHDGCYAGHWTDRSTCDAWFRNDMLKVCKRVHWRLGGNCMIIAYTYYGFVRMFGQKYYDSEGKMVHNRINTPVG